ncbi:MAG TPA: hypothetical protein VN958_12190, partial [Chitinophagaceae bacterium]|nr:hypothetical protein [Chitinophagaceae bacterium]
MKKFLCIFPLKCAFNFLLIGSFILLILPRYAWSQIRIPNTTTITENFDAIGSSPTATLPSNWKMSHDSIASPAWNDAGNFTATNRQASSGSPSTGARYNWGKTGGTDRSIGFISSGTYLSPNSVMTWYRNTGTDNINSLTISYDLFQFRINTEVPTVTFYYSTDGTNWTSFTSGDAQTISTGTSAYNFSTPANYGQSTNAGTAAFTISGLSVPIGGDIYLRWNFKTVGSSNSEGLGLDNVSVTASFCSLANVTGLGVVVGNGKLPLSWTNPPCFDEILVIAATHSVITSVPSGDGSAYTATAVYAGGNSNNGLNGNEFAVYKSTTGTSVTVTGLNNGTIYYFKVFTRRGTSWSSGVTVNGTPVAPFTGEFRSKASGNWTNNNTWEKFSGGVWVNAASGEFPNYKTSNVTIQSGDIIQVGAGPYAVNSLIVE